MYWSHLSGLAIDLGDKMLNSKFQLELIIQGFMKSQ